MEARSILAATRERAVDITSTQPPAPNAGMSIHIPCHAVSTDHPSPLTDKTHCWQRKRDALPLSKSGSAAFLRLRKFRPVLGSPTRKIAIGNSLSAVQHLVSLTRKSQSSVASNGQADFCSQGIKRPAYTPPAFDGLYFLRMYPSYIRWFWWIVKLEWCA